MREGNLSMIQIKALDHVVLRAVDADAMIRFYCDVLGCVVERMLQPDANPLPGP